MRIHLPILLLAAVLFTGAGLLSATDILCACDTVYGSHERDETFRACSQCESEVRISELETRPESFPALPPAPSWSLPAALPQAFLFTVFILRIDSCPDLFNGRGPPAAA